MPEKNFESLLKELEAITLELKKDDLALETAVALYKKGVALSKTLTTMLNEAKAVVIKEIHE